MDKQLTLEELHKMEMAQLLKERETTEPDPVIWRWSPLEIAEFDIMLSVAYDYFHETDSHSPGPISLAEAGSGIGTKLYLAKHKYRLAEYGYEINPDYIAKAKALDVQCELRDLGDLDNQPIWSAFDIVYIARPFKNDIFEAKWERSVHDAMRPGSVLIAAFAGVKPYSWECFYRRPFRGVWAKPKYELDSPEPKRSLVSVS